MLYTCTYFVNKHFNMVSSMQKKILILDCTQVRLVNYNVLLYLFEGTYLSRLFCSVCDVCNKQQYSFESETL